MEEEAKKAAEAEKAKDEEMTDAPEGEGEGTKPADVEEA